MFPFCLHCWRISARQTIRPARADRRCKTQPSILAIPPRQRSSIAAAFPARPESRSMKPANPKNQKNAHQPHAPGNVKNRSQLECYAPAASGPVAAGRPHRGGAAEAVQSGG